jgi:DNA-directed RNA polymerase beta' subunit
MSMVDSNIPLTGPAAIEHALSRVDMDAAEQEHRHMVKNGPVSKRGRSVNALHVLEGLKRNNLKPSQLMVKSVPVIPPSFRPFSVVGNTFVPGDANELYKDLFYYRDVYKQSRDVLGEKGAASSVLDLYDTTKALYGYSEPIAPKTKQRNVSGFLHQITGTSPKLGFVQRKLISKPQDSVSRGTIAVDPELSLDEVGVPKDMAWKIYAAHIQRRLVRSGMKPGDALMQVKDRTEMAERALQKEVQERPVIYSRAPSWHKFNVIAGKPKLIDGDTIMISPLVTSGMTADFDGDQINVHVPAMPESVKEAYEKLLPSKMLWSIKNQDTVMHTPGQEMILGLYTANKRPAKRKHKFSSEQAAIAAIRSGEVDLSDEIEISKV